MTLAANMVSLQARLQPQAQPSDWFWCKACSKLFKERIQLAQHNTEVHGKPSTNMPCALCSKVFPSKQALIQHVSENHAQYKTVTMSTVKQAASNMNRDMISPEEVIVVQKYPSEIINKTVPPYQTTPSFKKTQDWLDSNNFDEVFYDINEDFGPEPSKKKIIKNKIDAKEPKPKVRSRITKKQTARKRTTKPYAPPPRPVSKKAVIDERHTNVSVVLYRGDYTLCKMCGKTFLDTESYQQHRHYMTKAEVEALNRKSTPVVMLDRLEKATSCRTLQCAKCGLRLPSRSGLSSHQRSCQGEKYS